MLIADGSGGRYVPKSSPAVPGAGTAALPKTTLAKPRDVFQAQPAPSAPAQAAVAPPAWSGGGLSATDLDSAQQAVALASDRSSAQPVADWLHQHPDPSTQDQFFDVFAQYGTTAGRILDQADVLSDADANGLAAGLDHAYRSGAVTRDEIGAMVGTTGDGAAALEDHEGLAGLMGRTGNPELIGAYADREIDILQADPDQEAPRARAVATALGSLEPADLQGFLATHHEAMPLVVSNVNANDPYSESPALGRLLVAATRIDPATPESVALFTRAIDVLGANPSSRDGAARFMLIHLDDVVGSLQDPAGSLTVAGQGKLSQLFARTLFTEPAYPSQELLRGFVSGKLSAEATSLSASAEADEAGHRAARRLGSVVGAVEGGFQIAADELGQRNQAVEGMVDMIFRGVSFLTDAAATLAIPETGGASAAVGMAQATPIDEIRDWVVATLREQPQDAHQALPYHQLIGQVIGSAELRTSYDAARADAYVNRAVGLT